MNKYFMKLNIIITCKTGSTFLSLPVKYDKAASNLFTP